MQFHSQSGHAIQESGNWMKGKWKVPTKPGFARFFRTLGEARKWCKDNPKPEDEGNGGPLMRMVEAMAGKAAP